MAYICFYLALVFSLNVLAYQESPSFCGQYEVAGKLLRTSNKQQMYLVVHSDSKSEIKIEMPKDVELKLLAYLNRDVVVTGHLLNKFDQTSGRMQKLTSISDYNPYAKGISKNSGFNLLKKERCREKL